MLGIFVICVSLVSHSYGSPTSPTYDTIVVGLGAAGTAAASTLAKAGRKVLALEAQNRIGGRVHTMPFGNSFVEIGAEWIHGTESSSTYELAVKNNITILDDQAKLKVYYSDGSTKHEQLITDLVSFALEAVAHPPKEPEPTGQYLTRRIRDHIKTEYPSIQNDTDFINGFLEFMDIIITTYESSNSWNDVTTHSTSVTLKGSQTMSWHTYGYKTLFEILLNTYNNGPGYPSLETRLGAEVTHIQWSQDPLASVQVTLKDGTVYSARNVIVTLSVGVLKERYESLFSPPLPEQKVEAIKAISMGVCSKTIFRFPTVWWTPKTFNGFLWRDADRATVSDEDKWLLKIEGAGVSMSSNETLTLWACGDTAKKTEELSEDELKSKMMGLLRRFMGANKTIPEPLEMLRTKWHKNRFTRGSYSYDNVDLPKHPEVRGALAAPLTDSAGVPRVLFAGEATDTLHFATVHGAVDSGYREAARILAADTKVEHT